MSNEKYFSTLEYYPDRWRELKEIQAIIASSTSDNEGGYDNAVNNLIQSLENVFLLSDNDGNGGADEYGCERWEKILGIVPPANATIKDRRYAIWLATLDPRPYTWSNLHALLNKLLGSEDLYIVERNTETKTLQIRLFSETSNQQNLVLKFLDDLVPMDVILTIGQYYNRYSELKSLNKPYTHFNQFTYEQLKSDRTIVGR